MLAGARLHHGLAHGACDPHRDRRGDRERRAARSSRNDHAWPPRPNFVLTPAGNPADPAGPMSAVQMIEDLDRPLDDREEQSAGNWVIAPLPFRNELLGIGLVLGAGYLYGAPENGSRRAPLRGRRRGDVRGRWQLGRAGGASRLLVASSAIERTIAIATGELLYDVELQVGDDERKLGLQQEFSGSTLQGAVRVGDSGWLGLGYLRGTTDIRIRAHRCRCLERSRAHCEHRHLQRAAHRRDRHAR